MTSVKSNEQSSDEYTTLTRELVSGMSGIRLTDSNPDTNLSIYCYTNCDETS